MRVILQEVDLQLPLDLVEFQNSSGIRESDTFLYDMFRLAIGNIETRAGISILKKKWKIVHNNCYINLCNGPVHEIISIKDSKGNSVEPISLSRVHDNVLLKFADNLGFITVIYTAGYDANNLPFCLKNSIEQEFYKLYFDNESKLGCSDSAFEHENESLYNLSQNVK